jgi:hypothetical protein
MELAMVYSDLSEHPVYGTDRFLLYIVLNNQPTTTLCGSYSRQAGTSWEQTSGRKKQNFSLKYTPENQFFFVFLYRDIQSRNQ